MITPAQVGAVQGSDTVHPLAMSSTPEHYTPRAWVDRARQALGGEIDLDPCSSAEAQKVVCATRYYRRADDGLEQPWDRRVFVNPPGDPRGALPRCFWRKLQEEIEAGRVDAFIWLAFNISHLRTLRPRNCMIAVPHERIRFTGASPTKDNAILGRGMPWQQFFGAFGGVATCWRP